MSCVYLNRCTLQRSSRVTLLTIIVFLLFETTRLSMEHVDTNNQESVHDLKERSVQESRDENDGDPEKTSDDNSNLDTEDNAATQDRRAHVGILGTTMAKVVDSFGIDVDKHEKEIADHGRSNKEKEEHPETHEKDKDNGKRTVGKDNKTNVENREERADNGEKVEQANDTDTDNDRDRKERFYRKERSNKTRRKKNNLHRKYPRL